MDEEKTHLSFGMVLIGILLFIFIPFVFIFKSKMSRSLKLGCSAIYFVLLMAIGQYACINQGPVIKDIEVENITMKVGETVTLGYTYTPTNTTIKEDSYSVGNKEIAVIDGSSLTAQQVGTTKVTCKVSDNHYTSISKKITVTVIQ